MTTTRREPGVQHRDGRGREDARGAARPSAPTPSSTGGAGATKRHPTLREQLAELQQRYEISTKASLRYADDLEAVMKRGRDLRQQLQTTERQLDAFAGERDFLWEEIDRYRNRLIDFLRWDAMLPEKLRDEVRRVRAADYADNNPDSGDATP